MPRKGVEGGDLPLWCRDITPREYRVPTDEEHVTHPCGAVGVGRGEGMKYEEAYKAAIGTEGLVMGLPRAVKGVQGPGVRIVEREIGLQDGKGAKHVPVALRIHELETLVEQHGREQRAQAIKKRTGGMLVVLVSDAGTDFVVPLVDTSIDDAKKLYDLNVWGILGTNASVRTDAHRGQGRDL
ncbi:hypothetical protein H2203_002601 [Taxawa tesnikishii (nom. ined.)]|nr:hypothetical protein H2203_002601 [Dothideales sp. JES 119]